MFFKIFYFEKKSLIMMNLALLQRAVVNDSRLDVSR